MIHSKNIGHLGSCEIEVGGLGVVRVYGPTLIGLTASAVGFVLLAALHGHPVFAGVVLVWCWTPALVGLAALGHGAWVTWQLRQAELGLRAVVQLRRTVGRGARQSIWT